MYYSDTLMRAMQLTSAASGRVELTELQALVPGPTDVVVRVRACGVCRTDRHVVYGELPDIRIPVVPGHEIVGTVERVGREVRTHAPGDRVGIPWLGWACGVCEFCQTGRENERFLNSRR